MDDEREVNGGEERRDPETQALVEQSKMLFLRQIIDEFTEKQAQYNLEDEFAKTRENRTLLVPLTVLAIVLLFTGAMIGVTWYIQRSSQDIRISIEEFEDVNLREVLDGAQRIQNQLDNARRELQSTISERDSAIQSVREEAQRRINLLENEEITAAERNARAQRIEEDAEVEITSIREEYAAEIQDIEARFAELEDQMAQYDSRQLEQAREQEEILNNQQRVFDLRMEELRQEYEERIQNLSANYENRIAELEQYQAEFERTIRRRHANEIARLREQHNEQIRELIFRFNPQIEEASLSNLMNRDFAPEIRSKSGLEPYRALLGEEGAITRREYGELAQNVDEFARIVNRLQEVPYVNSVPLALDQLEFRNLEIIDRYESIWRSLAQSVISRDAIIEARESTISGLEEEIDEFLYALDSLTRENRENGYILDPRRPGEIVVYIDRIRDVADGTEGYVFREDDEYIATIEFSVAGREVSASVIEVAEGKELQPFDKVLIQVEQAGDDQ
ncbi:MAG: hypothetical protein ACLFPP_04515 [Spirochaetaceae bacterium]